MESMLCYSLIFLLFAKWGSGHESYDDKLFEKSFLGVSEKGEKYRDIVNLLSPLYLPKLGGENLSDECSKSLAQIHFSLLHNLTSNPWVLKLVDSWGKFEDGVLQGNNQLLGFFEECISIQSSPASNGASVKGQYCRLEYKRTSNESEERMPQAFIPFKLDQLLTSYATCMPASCTSQELVDSVNLALESTDVQITKCNCQTDESPALDGSEIFGICFFSVLICLLIVASLFDLITEWLHKKKIRKSFAALLAFSVPQNFTKIITLDTNPPPEVISCIHGLRVFTVIWVIWCHQYTFSTIVSSNGYSFKITQPFLFQIVSNGDKSVDTFFTISGFLVAYNIFKALKKNPKFPVAMYYIHRFIRLTPPIAIAVTFFSTIAALFVRGPYAIDYKENFVENCRGHWWMDPTYIGDFYYRYVDPGGYCIDQCWYTAVDTQFYLLLPIVLIPLYFYGKKGLAWLYFWIGISVLIPAVIIGINDTYPTLVLSLNYLKAQEYSTIIYAMPWCRATPYLVGTLAGFILHKYPKGQMKLNLLTVATGWTSMSVLAFTIIYCLAPLNYIDTLYTPSPVDDMSLAFSIIYGSLHRGLWAVWISWIILACHWGYGGIVHRFLSYPSFQPVSRLTYCMFLMSIGIQNMAIYSTKRLTYYTNFSKFEETCVNFVVIMLASLLLNLIAESPILRIEKIIIAKGYNVNVKNVNRSNGSAVENKEVHTKVQIDVLDQNNKNKDQRN